VAMVGIEIETLIR